MQGRREMLGLEWSEWLPHRECWRNRLMPKQPGLYRIRRVGSEVLDYVGQTGGGTSNLRSRLSAQREVYGNEMPFADPHTAAPGLWALRQEQACEFETSVAVLIAPDQVRKAQEAAVIALHRQQFGHSPSINFGRVPPGWKKSSGVSRQLAAAGKQFRGYRCDVVEQHHQPSIPPVGPMTGGPASTDWCGHTWSEWMPIADAIESLHAGDTGLYRLRGGDTYALVYLGEGAIATRLRDHLKSTKLGIGRKSKALASASDLQASHVVNNSWSKTQRLELECDLIGAYFLSEGGAPIAQFGGAADLESAT